MNNRRWVPEVIVRAMDRIESDLERSWSLQEMSTMAGFSTHHFHRKFRDATGETPTRFFERLRLERAALLLLSSGMSITALAWKSGFRNPETFARRFRSQFGITARDYRRHQLDLWREMGFVPGQDPVDGPGRIEVIEIQTTPVIVQRSLGEDEGFIFCHHKSPWCDTTIVDSQQIGMTLDWPGITEPGRVRQDWGVPPGDNQPPPPGWTRRTMGGGYYARLRIPGDEPVPNLVYQRLFVWALGGRYRLRPGATFETHTDGITVVHQPITDTVRE